MNGRFVYRIACSSWFEVRGGPECFESTRYRRNASRKKVAPYLVTTSSKSTAFFDGHFVSVRTPLYPMEGGHIVTLLLFPRRHSR